MLDISIWLIPQKEQEDSLQNIINSLALKYQVFPFLPHITAYYLGNSMELNKVIGVLQSEIKNTKAFTLTLENIYYSEQFTKTLFARYQISSAFQSLYKRLREKFYSIYPYELNPHLSLIYKNNMNEKDKQKEREQLKVPQQLSLDRLLVITKTGSIIAQERDVLDWKVAFTLPLQ